MQPQAESTEGGEQVTADEGFPDYSAADDASALARTMSRRMSAIGVPVAGLDDEVRSIGEKLRSTPAAARERLIRAAAMRLAGAANRALARRGDPRRWHAMLGAQDPTTAPPRWFLVEASGKAALATRGYRPLGRVMGRQLASLPLAVLAWVLIIVAVWRSSLALGCAAAGSYALWLLARSWLRRSS
jgi:hypothetical protein